MQQVGCLQQSYVLPCLHGGHLHLLQWLEMLFSEPVCLLQVQDSAQAQVVPSIMGVRPNVDRPVCNDGLCFIPGLAERSTSPPPDPVWYPAGHEPCMEPHLLQGQGDWLLHG